MSGTSASALPTAAPGTNPSSSAAATESSPAVHKLLCALREKRSTDAHDAVRQLLDDEPAAADRPLTDKWTVLHFAAYHGDAAVVNALLRAADGGEQRHLARDVGGLTPLAVAAAGPPRCIEGECAHYTVVRALLTDANGAWTAVDEKELKSALKWAFEAAHVGAFRALGNDPRAFEAAKLALKKARPHAPGGDAHTKLLACLNPFDVIVATETSHAREGVHAQITRVQVKARGSESDHAAAALKIALSRSEAASDDMRREARVLCQVLNLPRDFTETDERRYFVDVVHVYESGMLVDNQLTLDGGQPAFLLGWCEAGSLSANNRPDEQIMRLRGAAHVLRALDIMHTRFKYLHLDVHPSNVLITISKSSKESDQWWFRLADFGKARSMQSANDDEQPYVLRSGIFTAPEVSNLDNWCPTRFSDFWSWAVFVVELMTYDKESIELCQKPREALINRIAELEIQYVRRVQQLEVVRSVLRHATSERDTDKVRKLYSTSFRGAYEGLENLCHDIGNSGRKPGKKDTLPCLIDRLK